jgi:hypothetical protein
MKGQQATLLSEPDLAVEEDKRIGKLLSFFGVRHRRLSMAEFLADSTARYRTAVRPGIFSSAEVFLRSIEALERNPEHVQAWRQRIHSVFVFPGADRDSLQKLARILIGNERAVLCEIDPGAEDFVVSDRLNDFCGVMTGVRVTGVNCKSNRDLILNTGKGDAINIISLGDGAVFLKLEYKGVPVFLSTSREIIDIDAELASQNFDVREHFLAAVPLVLYIKWAFAQTCWNAPEANACLVIDDPLLKPTHGFVDFEELLSLMKQHNFSTNIAFIPWNWRRSAPGVVRLFRENPKCYSLSVHGCDHTRAEFGSSNQERLFWKAEQAAERMNRHRSMTGIRHDPVMVFPQGIFSEAAMRVLKHTDLIGAVNNDVVSADPCPRAITISDVWDIAVMGYSFPLFTRRYPWEGIENFAFDTLLGKPAIAVIHHDYCSDHGTRLVNFVKQVNALQCAPTWRNLGDVVRRSCRQRGDSAGAMEVEMYGTELRIENRSGQPKRFLIRRRECEPSAIERICTDAQEIAWRQVNGRINFEIDLNPNEYRVIKIKFRDFVKKGGNGDNLPYRFKTMLRRYLCEMRDNYVAPARFWLAGSC